MIDLFVWTLVILTVVFAVINIVQARLKAIVAYTKPEKKWLWDRMIAKRIVLRVQGCNVYAIGPLAIKVWVCSRHDVDDAHRTAQYQLRKIVMWLADKPDQREPVYSVREQINSDDERTYR